MGLYLGYGVLGFKALDGFGEPHGLNIFCPFFGRDLGLAPGCTLGMVYGMGYDDGTETTGVRRRPLFILHGAHAFWIFLSPTRPGGQQQLARGIFDRRGNMSFSTPSSRLQHTARPFFVLSLETVGGGIVSPNSTPSSTNNNNPFFPAPGAATTVFNRHTFLSQHDTFFDGGMLPSPRLWMCPISGSAHCGGELTMEKNFFFFPFLFVYIPLL